jgi:hypothetical protein
MPILSKLLVAELTEDLDANYIEDYSAYSLKFEGEDDVVFVTEKDDPFCVHFAGIKKRSRPLDTPMSVEFKSGPRNRPGVYAAKDCSPGEVMFSERPLVSKPSFRIVERLLCLVWDGQFLIDSDIYYSLGPKELHENILKDIIDQNFAPINKARLMSLPAGPHDEDIVNHGQRTHIMFKYLYYFDIPFPRDAPRFQGSIRHREFGYRHFGILAPRLRRFSDNHRLSVACSTCSHA